MTEARLALRWSALWVPLGIGLALLCTLAAFAGFHWFDRAPALRTSPPLPPPDRGMQVYHLGHSLVGADIPHLVQQFAGTAHSYHSQRGSGTSLRAHWEDDEPILDFNISNPPKIWRDARTAIGSGSYDAVILTEMVELRDAIAYFEGPKYAHRWAEHARSANPQVRLYLYETWHRLDDPEGWLTRIDRDLADLWLGRLLARDRRLARDQAIYLVPGGQTLAAVARAAEAGELPGIATREALFARLPNGAIDPIHLSPLGNYVVAMAHFSVLYHRPPYDLPSRLFLADGTPFQRPQPETDARLQHIVWDVVSALPQTGLSQPSPEAQE